jgi:hypothetical protein
MPREGSCELACSGKLRNSHPKGFAVATGRKSVALKLILETVAGSPGERVGPVLIALDKPLAFGFALLSDIFVPFRESFPRVASGDKAIT